MVSPAFRAFMDQRVRLWALARVSDGMGGSTETVRNIRDVDAAVRPATPGERADALQLSISFDHWLYLDAKEEVSQADRFAIIDRPGETYRIVEAVDPAYQGHHLEVRALREAHAPPMPEGTS